MDTYFAGTLSGSTWETLAAGIMARATLVLAAAGIGAGSARLVGRLAASRLVLRPGCGTGTAGAGSRSAGWSWRVLPAATETVRPIPSASGRLASHPARPGEAQQPLEGLALEENSDQRRRGGRPAIAGVSRQPEPREPVDPGASPLPRGRGWAGLVGRAMTVVSTDRRTDRLASVGTRGRANRRRRLDGPVTRPVERGSA